MIERCGKIQKSPNNYYKKKSNDIYIMGCELCNNNSVRNYYHIMSSYHRKNLLKKMRALKEASIQKWGYFKWE